MGSLEVGWQARFSPAASLSTFARARGRVLVQPTARNIIERDGKCAVLLVDATVSRASSSSISHGSPRHLPRRHCGPQKVSSGVRVIYHAILRKCKGHTSWTPRSQGCHQRSGHTRLDLLCSGEQGSTARNTRVPAKESDRVWEQWEAMDQHA